MFWLLLLPVHGLNMKTKPQWLATRVLGDLANPDAEFEVQLGFPVPWENELWRCAFRVKGLSRKTATFGIGCDALYALTSALDGIAMQLRASGRTFKWIDLAGESGIRRQIPIFCGAKFANEIEKHIDKKMEAFARKGEKKMQAALDAQEKPKRPRSMKK
jgi:hypothetical protein